jgi:hypothetical protein
VPGKSLLFGILSALLAGFGSPVAAEPHLGRSPGADDAVIANLKLNQDRPAVAVRVTNPTGRPLLLRGWLDGEEATAIVPERSAMVTLSWGTAAGGELVLELYPDVAGGGQAVDRETYQTAVRSGAYYYTPVPSARPSIPSPPASHPVQGSSAPPSDKDGPVALPMTGASLEPYVLLGGGLLGFGVLVLGLSWIWSRRSRTD